MSRKPVFGAIIGQNRKMALEKPFFTDLAENLRVEGVLEVLSIKVKKI